MSFTVTQRSCRRSTVTQRRCRHRCVRHSLATRTFDSIGRPTSLIDPLGHVGVLPMDGNGLVTDVTLPGSNTLHYEYDAT